MGQRRKEDRRISPPHPEKGKKKRLKMRGVGSKVEIQTGKLTFSTIFKHNTIFPKIRTGRARCWWLRLLILATQEAEIRKITVQTQPGK
jgi:hypothetical protein